MKMTELNKVVQEPRARGMHSELLEMIQGIRKSRSKWGLSFSFKRPATAKRRLYTLKKAKAKGTVKFAQAFQRGAVVYVQRK